MEKHQRENCSNAPNAENRVRGTKGQLNGPVLNSRELANRVNIGKTDQTVPLTFGYPYGATDNTVSTSQEITYIGCVPFS